VSWGDLAEIHRGVTDSHACTETSDIPTYKEHGNVDSTSLKGVSDYEKNSSNSGCTFSAPGIGDISLNYPSEESKAKKPTVCQNVREMDIQKVESNFEIRTLIRWHRQV
jgi:hypothetical protein